MRQMNLQDIFLNQVRKEKISVTIYLTNGFQFKGIVQGFDSFTVVLNSEERQNLVYKHAISTIIPSRAIHLSLATIDRAGAASETETGAEPKTPQEKE